MEEKPITEQQAPVKSQGKSSKRAAAAPESAQGRVLPQRVYIGPNRPFGLPLMQFGIVRGDQCAAFPKLTEHMAANPELQKLFVSVPELAAARAQLKENGSALYLAFAEISKASAAHKQ